MATQGMQGAPPTSSVGGRDQFVNRRYRVVRQLGIGGMGTVYLVEDTLDENQLLALKTIRTGVTSKYTLSAFRNEFQAMTQFHHPNVVEVYDFGNLNAEEDFFTMEVVEGRDLLAATESASLDEIYDYAIQIGRALEYIHSQGFIHFDLKPDNIMVRTGGTVKVMDFGLVEDLGAIQQGTVKGSVHYIAPEMVRGGAIDHRFDLYSLGAVLFHVLVGRPLFDGSAAQVMHHHVQTAPDFDTDARRRLSPEVRGLLSRLLAKDPAERIPSASDFLVEMARIAGTPGAVVAAREVSESYMLASRFVARDGELGHLKASFAQRIEAVVAGAPPLQLLAGPAGIGRSRLAQELRHYVQLRGVRFAHGSSLEDAGQPGLPFSEVIRVLVREILPSESGEELASFRDALRVSYVIGEQVTSTGDATIGQRPTLATLPPAPSMARPPSSPAAAGSAPGAPSEGLPAFQGPHTSPHVGDTADHSGALSATMVRTVLVTPEARRPGDTEDSAPMSVIYSARPRAGHDSITPEAVERSARLRAALLDVLRPASPALARLLPDQPALRALGGDPPAFSSPRAEREWLTGAISRFLVDAARLHPLVLYISDLQWADELSIELLGRLAGDLHEHAHAAAGPDGGAPREPARLLLLGCYRDEEVPAGGPLHKAISGWTSAALAEVTTLPAMGMGELTRMLHSMLGPVSLPVRVSQRFLERTGGNPFLIEATVRGLLEQGAIDRKGSTFEIAEGALGALEPDAEGAAGAPALGTIDDVLDRMLARLQPRERVALELLAVFNRPTSALTLQMAAPELEDLPRLLSTLQRKRFLQRGWADGHYRYRLRHNQLRAHIYRALSLDDQARLHEAAGRAVEALHGGSDRYFEDIAQHFGRAGNAEKTLRYARAAAAHARRLYDLKRAAMLYLQAYEALGRLPPLSGAPAAPIDGSMLAGFDATQRRRAEAELAIEIAEVSYYSPSEASIERLQRAATLAAQFSDGTLQNRVQNWMGRTYYALGKQREAIRCFQEFMKGIADTQDDFARALPFTVLGRVYFFLGRFETAADYLGRGAALLRHVAGTDEDVSYAMGMGGAALAYLGRLDEGLTWIDESIEIARRINHQTRLALGLIYRGICCTHHGRWQEAKRALDDGLEICNRTGDVIGIGTGSSFRGQLFLAEGDGAEAERLARHGRAVIAKAGGTWTFTMIGSHLADALRMQGDLDGAQAAVDEARKVVEAGERWGECCLHVVAGRIAAARGQKDVARTALDKAIEVALSQKSQPFEGKARLALGQLLLSTGDPEGRAALEHARALFEQCNMTWYAEQATRVLAGDPAGPCP